MRQDSVTSKRVDNAVARATALVVALAVAPSCDTVLGIQEYEAGPAEDGGEREAGKDATHDSHVVRSDATDVARDTNACTSGDKRCSGSGVETCASGHWGAAVACGGATPHCYGGSCTATPPSCAPGGAGMTDCGASHESCCTSLDVMGGTYHRTYSNSGEGGKGEADPASVSTFGLEKYLVTVGRFRQFVLAWNGGASYLPPAGSGKHTHLNTGQGLANSGSPGAYEPGWLDSYDGSVGPTNFSLNCHAGFATWTASAGKNEDLPINCVNWYEAYAFCIWDGGFLPSEAEWEYAAAGGSAQREYPWGATAPGTGNQYAIYGCDYPSGSGTCTGVSSIAPVGTAGLGGGVWGQLDLEGDLAQWNLDFFDTYVDPCADCAYLQSAAGRVVRGASFLATRSALVPPSRGYVDPSGRNFGVGFRCATTP
jgi:formylglycine-generating enzyme required for sulfatase activity